MASPAQVQDIEEIEEIDSVPGTPRITTRFGCWKTVKKGCVEVNANQPDSKRLLEPTSTEVVPAGQGPRRSRVCDCVRNIMSFFTSKRDENRPFILKPCKSPNIRCCYPKISKLSPTRILIYVQHWTDHLQRLDALDKEGYSTRERIDFATAADQIFNGELVDGILRRIEQHGAVGVVNNSSDCFAIVILQSLMACPPFLEYVANKRPGKTLDHVVRSFVAQYIVKYEHISCRSIIDMIFPEYDVNHQEDAEKFYESFGNAYLNNLGKAKAHYTLTCTTCGNVGIKEGPQDNHVSLDWPDQCDFETITIQEMIEKTSQTKEIDDYRCEKCNGIGCMQETKYDLPDIMLAYMTPFYFTAVTHPCRNGKRDVMFQRNFRDRIIDFSRVEDFGLISRTQPSIYNLASVVYYNEGTLASGHYTASTWRKEAQYVHDDIYCELISKGDARLAGRPYFAIYYNATTSNKSNVQAALSTVTELE